MKLKLHKQLHKFFKIQYHYQKEENIINEKRKNFHIGIIFPFKIYPKNYENESFALERRE